MMTRDPSSMMPLCRQHLLATIAHGLLWLSAFLLSPMANAQDQENLSAFVDRTDVSVNDVITLTVRVGSLLGDARPSIDVLDEDFDLLGTTTSNSYSNINGNVQSWTEYRISLKPKRTGEITIPSFEVEHESTDPIEISVSEPDQVSSSADRDVFLRTSVDKNSLYVQEQLIFSIKLYYSVRFDQGAQLSTPDVDDVVIQQLGNDQNYQEIVDGIRYDVTERRYVIFPQSSGSLEIPPIEFNASVGNRSGRLLNRRRNNPTRQINLSSEAHDVTIKPVPESFTGDTWLPASNLTFEEKWSGTTDEMDVGDSLTRNIRVVVDGLSSSLLPDISHAPLDGVKFYSDQTQSEDSANRQGVVGSLRSSTAVVPSRPGSFTLPAMRITWWNTQTDRQEIAVLPERTLDVAGPAVTSSTTEPEEEAGSPEPEEPDTSTPDSTSESSAATSRIWIATTVGFGVAWALTTLFLIRSRRHDLLPAGLPLVSERTAPGGNGINTNKSDAAQSLKHFNKACDRGDPALARRHLIEWAQAFWANDGIHSLQQVREHFNDSTLTQLLMALERSLYGAEGEAPFTDYKALEARVNELSRQGRAHSHEMDALPPLYKN